MYNVCAWLESWNHLNNMELRFRCDKGKMANSVEEEAGEKEAEAKEARKDRRGV